MSGSAEAARIAAVHWQLNPATGLLLARPPDGGLDIEALVTESRSLTIPR